MDNLKLHSRSEKGLDSLVQTIVSGRKSELQAIDRKTRKLFIIYGALHPKSDVGRLYIPRKGGGCLISIEDCVVSAIRGLEVYVHGSEERLIQAAARGDKIDGLEAGSSYSIRPYSIIVL